MTSSLENMNLANIIEATIYTICHPTTIAICLMSNIPTVNSFIKQIALVIGILKNAGFMPFASIIYGKKDSIIVGIVIAAKYELASLVDLAYILTEICSADNVTSTKQPITNIPNIVAGDKLN